VGGLWESVAFIGHCVYWVWYLLDVVLLGVEFTGSPGNIGREYWTLRVSLPVPGRSRFWVPGFSWLLRGRLMFRLMHYLRVAG